MRYTGIQPQYFPRLHYFARFLNADIFMIRDECQFVIKHKYPDNSTGPSFQVHTPIKISTGSFLLNTPVRHSGRQPISEIILSYEQSWIEQHLKTLEFAYKKAPNFSIVFHEIEQILKAKYSNLVELSSVTIYWAVLRLLGEKQVNINALSLEYMNQVLRAQTTFRLKSIQRSSLLNVVSDSDSLTANEKIVAICKAIGASEDYCGGTSISAYLDHKVFEKNNINVVVQNWKCQQYRQMFQNIGFIGNLSIIDLLMNTNLEESIKIMNG